VGEEQDHTFCPQGDLDRAVFTAKAGYAYEVETANLSLGVDTFVSVQIGDVTLTNDDDVPQGLSSRVQISNTLGTDSPAFITVRNKGLFGFDHSGNARGYTLRVNNVRLSEGDDFEPDDEGIGSRIAFGAPQQHSFAPTDDVDKVNFLVEPDQFYSVRTLDLAPGVDTVLTVDVEPLDAETEAWIHLTNDDVRRPGDLSSLIEFRYDRTELGRAVVTIEQKGEYGVDKTYLIQVDQVGDKYERDDVSGMPISIGGSQSRTFDPQGDVDKVHFVAKAGHRYRIRTSSLAPLVDTSLRVEMGSTHLTNDDRMPGDLSSYVEIQNDGPDDSRVMVTITNDGQYGPERSYTIQVEDLGAESGDEYEPDMDVKRYISVNEVQRHTFFPDADVDRVHLSVKAGREYRVATCGWPTRPSSGEPVRPDVLEDCVKLAPGVDSVLVVAGPIHNCEPASCQNDDDRPGMGYLNSRVTFEALVDGEVIVTLYNKGLFGPEMEYYLFAWEVAAATPTPTFTPSCYPLSARGSFLAARSGQPPQRNTSLLPLRSLFRALLQDADEGKDEDVNVQFVLLFRMRPIEQ
jgi:hypothetical protein